jgi:zinc transport system ATP-binding protein
MTAETEQPVVCLRDDTFAYEATPVLEHAHLDVFEGAFASIVGPNGGGKTTLLRLILGLLKPNTGNVQVFGDAPARARARIGYTPQHLQFDAQFPVTVMDVVLMGRAEHCPYGRYRREDKEAARRALDDMDLANEALRPFAALSGGQRQRVLIARALACEPRLLLLDEPTANIDAAAGMMLLEHLQRLNERMTILLVSHDLGFVSKAVTSVICVNKWVKLHPTSNITVEIIREVYGGDVDMIRHDHRCPEGEHRHA